MCLYKVVSWENSKEEVSFYIFPGVKNKKSYFVFEALYTVGRASGRSVYCFPRTPSFSGDFNTLVQNLPEEFPI